MASQIKLRKSRKAKRTLRRTQRKLRNRRNTCSRGGSRAIMGASVDYSLSGSLPSRQSLGQGDDYFKYHKEQHGGALGMGEYPSAVTSTGLPDALRGPAHLLGIDKAMHDIKGLSDIPHSIITTKGGKRKNRRSTHGKSHRAQSHKKRPTRKSRRARRARRTHRGGSTLGYSSFPATRAMLLNSSKQYTQAGLNPEWKTDVAFTSAKIRNTQ